MPIEFSCECACWFCRLTEAVTAQMLLGVAAASLTTMFCIAIYNFR